MSELRQRAIREHEGAKKVLEQAEHQLEFQYWDAAISRAYYAIFHAARAVLYARGSEPTTHRGVVREFGRLMVKAGEVDEKYSEILRKAREERQTADYESYESELLPTEGLAREIVKEARQFVEQMANLLK